MKNILQSVTTSLGSGNISSYSHFSPLG